MENRGNVPLNPVFAINEYEYTSPFTTLTGNVGKEGTRKEQEYKRRAMTLADRLISYGLEHDVPYSDYRDDFNRLTPVEREMFEKAILIDERLKKNYENLERKGRLQELIEIAERAIATPVMEDEPQPIVP